MTVEFLEELTGFPRSGAPGHVVAFRAAFVQIVHLDSEDAVFQDTDSLDRIDAEAKPVAEIGSRPDTFTASFAEGAHHFGTPEVRRYVGSVVVDADIDGVFVGEPVEEVELFGLGFADKSLDTHFVSEFEEPAAGGLVGRDGLSVIHGHADTGGLELHADLKQFLVGETLVEVFRDILADLLHEAQPADVRKAEFRGLLDRLEEGELVEGISLDPEAPAELLLGPHCGSQKRAGGGWGRKIAKDELRRVKIKAEHCRIFEDVRAMGEGGVKDAAFAVVADPGEGVVVVGT